MIIGRMERYITIQQPTYTPSTDTNDNPISAWTTYKTCFAAWKHNASQEVFETGQMVAKDTYEFKFRHYDAPDVKMDMRILYDSKYYYFVGLKELGRKEAWQGITINRDN